MRDRYFEQFVTDEVEAKHRLDCVQEDYSDAGMYQLDGGFVVWADLESDRGL